MVAFWNPFGSFSLSGSCSLFAGHLIVINIILSLVHHSSRHVSVVPYHLGRGPSDVGASSLSHYKSVRGVVAEGEPGVHAHLKVLYEAVALCHVHMGVDMV